jgi:hypothetical protein
MQERKPEEQENLPEGAVPLILFDLKPIGRMKKVDVKDFLSEYRLSQYKIHLLQEQIIDCSQNLFESADPKKITTQEILNLSMQLEIQFSRADILERVLYKLGQEEIVDQINLFSR